MNGREPDPPDPAPGEAAAAGAVLRGGLLEYLRPVAAEASRRSSLMHALGAARATGWPISLALELEKPDPAALASRIGKLRDVIRLEEEI